MYPRCTRGVSESIYPIYTRDRDISEIYTQDTLVAHGSAESSRLSHLVQMRPRRRSLAEFSRGEAEIGPRCGRGSGRHVHVAEMSRPGHRSTPNELEDGGAASSSRCVDISGGATAWSVQKASGRSGRPSGGECHGSRLAPPLSPEMASATVRSASGDGEKEYGTPGIDAEPSDRLCSPPPPMRPCVVTAPTTLSAESARATASSAGCEDSVNQTTASALSARALLASSAAAPGPQAVSEESRICPTGRT